jgi:hypothetical protein
MIITLSILLFAAACTKKKQNKLDKMVILTDHSDVMPIYPSIGWFKALKKWNQTGKSQVTFERIDDLPFHNKQQISLDLKSGMLSNDLENRKQLKHFYQQAEHIINQQNKTQKSSPKSVIFPILAQHLNNGVSEVHLFTDMIENSFTKLNRFQTAQQIIKHKDQLILDYSKIPIQKGNTQVYVYFSPKDYEQGLYIQSILEIYKAVLEPKGYKIQMGQFFETTSQNTSAL